MIFVKQIFTAILQMYFQGFSEWLIGFKVYDTRYRRFYFNIKLKQLQITALKLSRDFSKTNNTCKLNFHCYRPNVSSKLLWMGFKI